MILKQLIKRTTNNTEEGVLCVAESQTPGVPFEIKRVYYTCGVEAGVTRGHHAHKELEQLLICPHGEIAVQMDDGKGCIETVTLNDQSQGLYVGPLMWHTMTWNKSDSVLLVLASDHYKEDDYIRSYDDFLSIVTKEERKEGRKEGRKTLVKITNDTKIKFTTRRLYYICGAKKNIVRGRHAHKKLEQILICPYGKIEITLDDGNNRIDSVILDAPDKGLYVGPSTWRTMKWLKDDSVLLVLASEHYDESDYIRNYDDFIKWVKQGENNADTI